MPIPKPSANQSRDAYISECMHALKDEKRPQEQKLAICFSTYKRAKQSKGSSEEPVWDEKKIVKDENGNCIIL